MSRTYPFKTGSSISIDPPFLLSGKLIEIRLTQGNGLLADNNIFFFKWTEPRIHGFLLLELYNVHSICPPIRHTKKLNRYGGEWHHKSGWKSYFFSNGRKDGFTDKIK